MSLLALKSGVSQISFACFACCRTIRVTSLPVWMQNHSVHVDVDLGLGSFSVILPHAPYNFGLHQYLLGEDSFQFSSVQFNLSNA